MPPHMSNIQGKQFMEESLRQRCLYEVIASENNQNHNFTQWFNYVLGFIDECSHAHNYQRNCSVKVMEKLNLNVKAVDKCYEKQFDFRGRTPIVTILEEDRNWAKTFGINLHPAISINNITYRGQFEGFDIFKAICAGFLEQPEICKGDKVLQFFSLENTGDLLYRRRSVIKLFHIVAAVIVVLLLNVLALCIYRKYQKRKVNEELQVQVNSAVSQYFRLSG